MQTTTAPVSAATFRRKQSTPLTGYDNYTQILLDVALRGVLAIKVM
jgi:hypothetical protein